MHPIPVASSKIRVQRLTNYKVYGHFVTPIRFAEVDSLYVITVSPRHVQLVTTNHMINKLLFYILCVIFLTVTTT